MIILVKVVLLLMIHHEVSSFRAYDCFSDTANITSVSLKDVSPCPDPSPEDLIVKETYVQIVQEKQWRMMHVAHCKVVVNKLITYCGMHSHVSLVDQGFQNYIQEISQSQCMEAHKTGVLYIGSHRVQELKPNTTQDVIFTAAGSISGDSSCEGESYSTPDKDYKNVVVQVSANIRLKDYETLLEMKTDNLLFNDGLACKTSEDVCDHPIYGSTFWELSKYEECNADSRDVIYEGEASITSSHHEISKGDVVTVNRGTSLFSLTVSSKSFVCHQRAYATDHPRVFVIMKEKYGFYFNKKDIMARNMDLAMYMNSKIAYTTRHSESLIKQVYIDLTKKGCEIERMALINKLAIVRQHPLAYGHLVTGEPGYYSIVHGEVAHMMKCQPVEVSVRTTSICSSNLPVMYGNRSMFMEPVARVLTNTSMEVPCSPLTPSMYEIHNMWYSFNPSPVNSINPIEIAPSQTMSPLKFQNIARLVSSGLYDKDAMNKFRNFMSFPMVRMDSDRYISAKLTNSPIYKDSIYSTDLLISERKIRETVSIHISKMFGFITTFGAWAGAIWGGIIVYKMTSKVFSVVINALHLHKAFGFGLHMFAAVLDALTHLVINVKKDVDDGNDSNESKGCIHETISMTAVETQSASQDNNTDKEKDVEQIPEVSVHYPTLPPVMNRRFL